MFVSKKKYDAIYQALEHSTKSEMDLMKANTKLRREYDELEDMYFELLDKVKPAKKVAKKSVAKKTTTKKASK